MLDSEVKRLIRFKLNILGKNASWLISCTISDAKLDHLNKGVFCQSFSS